MSFPSTLSLILVVFSFEIQADQTNDANKQKASCSDDDCYFNSLPKSEDERKTTNTGEIETSHTSELESCVSIDGAHSSDDSGMQLGAGSLLKYVNTADTSCELDCNAQDCNQVLASSCRCDSNFDQITDDEIRMFTEELLKKDDSSLFPFTKYSLQGKANKDPNIDEASEPLMDVDDRALQYPTVANLIALLDNYYPNAKDAEDVTDQERVEEMTFLDSILNTSVMNYTRDFLKEKGAFTGDREDFKSWLDLIWFSLYTRGYKKLSSSGFEHVFKGETRKQVVLGMHNWISFSQEEKQNDANYLGWMKNKNFGKGSLLTLRFTWNDKMKKIGSFFIGTSPEFEIALYSVCFILRNNKKCKIRLNENNMYIRTYAICNRNFDRVVGSVYAGN